MNRKILVAGALAYAANMLVFLVALQYMEPVYAGLLSSTAFSVIFWLVARVPSAHRLGVPGKSE